MLLEAKHSSGRKTLYGLGVKCKIFYHPKAVWVLGTGKTVEYSYFVLTKDNPTGLRKNHFNVTEKDSYKVVALCSLSSLWFLTPAPCSNGY